MFKNYNQFVSKSNRIFTIIIIQCHLVCTSSALSIRKFPLMRDVESIYNAIHVLTLQYLFHLLDNFFIYPSYFEITILAKSFHFGNVGHYKWLLWKR